MSGAKHFHRKEAARILIELRSKTEDERLMDYRRQLLQNDENVDHTQYFNEFQERLEQGLWPWPYPNPALPPFNPNALAYGYPPCVPNPAPAPMWFPPPAACAEPGKYTMQPRMPPIFQAMEFQHPFPWPPLPHHQGFFDTASRRRRTKFTNEQLTILEKSFSHCSKFPSPGERMRLETHTGLNKEKISVWFQNRRAKEKREKILEESKTEDSTTDSEDETDGDGGLRVCSDETPEEESEAENKVNSSELAKTPPSTPQTSSPSSEESPKEPEEEIFTADHASMLLPEEPLGVVEELSLPEEPLRLAEGPSHDTTAAEQTSDNKLFLPSICVVSDDDASIRVIDMTGKHCELDVNGSSQLEKPGFQNKRRKYFHASQIMPEYTSMSAQSYTASEYRPFGEA